MMKLSPKKRKGVGTLTISLGLSTPKMELMEKFVHTVTVLYAGKWSFPIQNNTFNIHVAAMS